MSSCSTRSTTSCSTFRDSGVIPGDTPNLKVCTGEPRARRNRKHSFARASVLSSTNRPSSVNMFKRGHTTSVSCPGRCKARKSSTGRSTHEISSSASEKRDKTSTQSSSVRSDAEFVRFSVLSSGIENTCVVISLFFVVRLGMTCPSEVFYP